MEQIEGNVTTEAIVSEILNTVKVSRNVQLWHGPQLMLSLT